MVIHPPMDYLKALIVLGCSLGCFGVTRAAMSEFRETRLGRRIPFSSRRTLLAALGVAGVLGMVLGCLGVLWVVKIFWGKL